MVLVGAIPKLERIDKCRACGASIGFVRVYPSRRWCAVDVEPHPGGEFILMRDGVHVAAPREEEGIRHLDDYESLAPVRYWSHQRTCMVPSFRTAEAALGKCLGFLEAKAVGDDRRAAKIAQGDPAREARRRAKLAADRARDYEQHKER